MAMLTHRFSKPDGNGSLWIAIGLWLVFGECVGKVAVLLHDSLCALGAVLLRAMSFDCLTEVLTSLSSAAGALVASFSWVAVAGPARLIIRAFCG
jgi:hypothetical protein